MFLASIIASSVATYEFDMTVISKSNTGLYDIQCALRLWPQWLTLGWYDFSVQHRRTLIGPFWQTIQVGIWVLGLSLVFGSTLSADMPEYPAYVAAGVIVWNFITGAITLGPTIFVRNGHLIQNVPNPLATFPLRELVALSLRFVFQLPAFVVVAVYLSINITFYTALFVLGMLAIMTTAFWVALFLATIGTRFRDLNFMLETVTRFLFFMSPIFWVPVDGTLRGLLATWNPFTYFIEIVRAPMLGEAPSLLAWMIVLAVLCTTMTITLVFYNQFRHRIVFWL